MTYEEILKNETIRTYVMAADKSLEALGYTEHSYAHTGLVAERVGYILRTLNYPERIIELGMIAGYMHDIGNLVNRVDHSQSGAIIAFRLLSDLNFDPEEISMIVSAIGTHDEGTGVPVSPLAAALIIADKSDVRRSRARKENGSSDIHYRVNYSVLKSELKINEAHTLIKLKLTVDTHYSSIMDYLEIFLDRMILCKKAASTLGLEFKLMFNEQQLI